MSLYPRRNLEPETDVVVSVSLLQFQEKMSTSLTKTG